MGVVIGCGGWADGARMFHVSGGPLRTKRGNNDEHEDEEEDVVGGVEGASVNADDMVRNSSQSNALVQRDSNWVPEEVIVIPVFRRPVFPGIATPIALTNPAFCEAILKLKDNSGTYPLVGIFMTKNPTREEGSPITSTDELHQIGCLGQVVYIHGVQQLGVQLLVAGAGRILITGTVRKEPFLSVSIAKVHDKKVDPQDKNIKAWVLEIISTMKSVVKLEHSFKEQLQTALTQVDVNNPGLLADITASMTTADRDSLQNVSKPQNTALLPASPFLPPPPSIQRPQTLFPRNFARDLLGHVFFLPVTVRLLGIAVLPIIFVTEFFVPAQKKLGKSSPNGHRRRGQLHASTTLSTHRPLPNNYDPS